MDSESHRIKLNVGGKHLETTLSTLLRTPISIPTPAPTSTSLFLDADPHHVTSLLSAARATTPPPPPFTPYDSSFTTLLSPPLHPLISTFSDYDSSLLVSHSNLLSLFHPDSLSLLSTTPTHLPTISSLSPVSDSLSALGSTSFSPPGLHLFSHSHFATLLWSDPSDLRTLKSRVTAIHSAQSLFASFHCRHGENALLVFDKSTLQVTSEIGRQSGNSAKSAPLTKITCVSDLGLVVGSSVTCGAFGYSGYVRMWDVRSGKVVWESGGEGRARRLGDSMADVDVDVEGGYLAKVGSRSGDVGLADLRRLGGGGDGDPWVYLEDPNPRLRVAGPVRGSMVVCCWKKHVFVGRDGALEAWSMVGGGGYRRNLMDKEEDEKRGSIRMIGGGGNRLFVARDGVEGLEVWETSRSSGIITLH